jgi:hypothetical protein
MRVRSGGGSPEHRHIFSPRHGRRLSGAMMIANGKRSNDRRPEKPQPDRMDACSWFGMTSAEESPAWAATAARSVFGTERS